MADNKKTTLWLLFLLFSFSTFAKKNKISSNQLFDLADFLESYGELDFYGRKNTYEFRGVHLFSKYSLERLEYEVEKEAIEKQILMALPKKVRKKASDTIRAVLVLCEKYQLDPYWVTALIWTESHFKIKAKSQVGANGLMQLMPETYYYLKKKMRRLGIRLEVEKDEAHLRSMARRQLKSNLNAFKETIENLEIGIYYLKRLNLRFKNPQYATVAYNMGPTWVRKSLKEKKKVGSSDNNYLNKVKKHYKELIKYN